MRQAVAPRAQDCFDSPRKTRPNSPRRGGASRRWRIPSGASRQVNYMAASSRKKNPQRLANRTDVGNAEVFAALFRNRLRFDHARQRWLWYAEHWWTIDIDGGIMRLAKQAARSGLKNSATVGDDEGRKKEAEWALRSESLPRLQAMLTLAKSEKPLADDGSKWDSDPWLLGVANGVVDLRTGRLCPGKMDDYITLHSAIAFDPNAKCPRFDRFLEEIFDGDPDLISYIHRAGGYSL